MRPGTQLGRTHQARSRVLRCQPGLASAARTGDEVLAVASELEADHLVLADEVGEPDLGEADAELDLGRELPLELLPIARQSSRSDGARTARRRAPLPPRPRPCRSSRPACCRDRPWPTARAWRGRACRCWGSVRTNQPLSARRRCDSRKAASGTHDRLGEAQDELGVDVADESKHSVAVDAGAEASGGSRAPATHCSKLMPATPFAATMICSSAKRQPRCSNAADALS